MRFTKNKISIVFLILLYVSCVLVSSSWSARGFDATDGVGSTDVVTTTHASNNTNTSWCMWVWRTGNSVSGNGRIVDKNSTIAGYRILYEDVGFTAYQFEADWSITNGRWTIVIPTATAWHHWCVTYNGGATTNNPVMYLDGSSVTVSSTADAPVGTLNIGAGVYTIGNRTDGIRAWNGRIAEVAIWEGTILTSGNITTLYNVGAGLRADSPVLGVMPTAYWPLCANSTVEPSAIIGIAVGTLTGTARQAHPFSNCANKQTILGVG